MVSRSTVTYRPLHPTTEKTPQHVRLHPPPENNHLDALRSLVLDPIESVFNKEVANLSPSPTNIGEKSPGSPPPTSFQEQATSDTTVAATEREGTPPTKFIPNPSPPQPQPRKQPRCVEAAQLGSASSNKLYTQESPPKSLCYRCHTEFLHHSIMPHTTPRHCVFRLPIFVYWTGNNGMKTILGPKMADAQTPQSTGLPHRVTMIHMLSHRREGMVRRRRQNRGGVGQVGATSSRHQLIPIITRHHHHLLHNQIKRADGDEELEVETGAPNGLCSSSLINPSSTSSSRLETSTNLSQRV